jgi:16S rRNA (cytosine967-C5)-methyltransferase
MAVENRSGARLRATAAEIVDAVVKHGRSLDAALRDMEGRVASDDQALLKLLCYGTLRRHWRLQALINAYLERPLKAKDSIVTALLATGLYQITETRIPDHAVVSQTVEAARILRRPKHAPLINAVLRRFLRDQASNKLPEVGFAAYDHPEWLTDALAHDWPDDWTDIVAANNARAPMWLRVNSTHGSAMEYQQQLREQGIEAELLSAAPQALRLVEPQPVENLPGFDEGLVSVQDAAAQLAAPWLLEGIQGRVLDACAAPGGKSGHLLEFGGAGIALTCIDKDEARLAAVTQNLSRLKLDATVIAADASNPDEWWDKTAFNAILLDAPCSATGVIRRHPDIKLLRRASDIQELARLQTSMLAALWPLLAPGGRLLYVTCSVLAEENDAVVRRFLASTSDARENDLLQDNNIRDLMRPKTCGAQILPGTAGLDGFYYACLEKVS